METNVKVAFIAGIFALSAALLMSPFFFDFFKSPEIEIIDVDYYRMPSNPGILKIIDTSINQTIATHDVASLPCLDIKIKNNGEKAALINKITIEVLGYKPMAGVLEPSSTFYIELNTGDIYSTLYIEDIRSKSCKRENYNYYGLIVPYQQNISTSFYVKPDEGERFRVIINSDLDEPISLKIKVILHYDHKKTESEPKDIAILKSHTTASLNYPDNLSFYTPVSYKTIGKEINKIKARAIIITIDACYSGSAIDPLREELENTPFVIVTAGNEDELIYESMFFSIFHEKFLDKSADKDRDCYVSLKEAFEAARAETINITTEEEFKMHPQIYDPYNLSSKIYPIEYNVCDETSSPILATPQ